MKSIGRANQKSIDKKNGEVMKTTCTDSATTPIIVKANLILKMITLSTGYEFREDNSDYDPAAPNARDYLIAFRGKINDFKVRDCKPLGTPNPKYSLIEWKDCECTIYLYIKDGKDGVIQIIDEYRYISITNAKRNYL